MTLPLCRHRSLASAAGNISCASPVLKLVDPIPDVICRGCVYPDLDERPPDPSLDRNLCLFRGQPIADSDLEMDSSRRPDLFTCGRHARCTVSRHREGVACCAACPDYRPRDASPEEAHNPANSLPAMIEALRGPRRAWPEDWPWWGTTVEAHHALAKEYAGSLPPYPEGRYAGRGIVIPGGGAFFPGVYVTVRMIRHFGCTLPIEVWHDAEREPLYPHWLEPFGVRIVDFSAHMTQHGMPRIAGGWANKFYAVLHSSFEEVLYLDSDCYPLFNLSRLFDQNSTGVLFWEDDPRCETNIRWHIYGTSPKKIPAITGGQFLLRKRDAWAGLLLAQWWNERADFTYCFGCGDQDVLRGVWGGSDLPHSFHPGVVEVQKPGLVFWSPDRKTPLFAHRFLDKFRLPFLGKEFSSGADSMFHHNRHPRSEAVRDDRYPGDALAFEFYGQFLRRFYTQTAWHDPAREDATIFPEVLQHNCYRLPEQLPHDSRVVDIGAHVGSFSLLALMRGAQQVWAFEPDPDNFRLCQKNLSFFGKRARVYQKAVWSHVGRVGLRRETRSYMGVTLADGEEVEALPLDDILEEASHGGTRTIPFLKLDCEGAEWAILFSSKMLHVCEAIVGEYHVAIWQGKRYELEDLKELLTRQGFRFESYPNDEIHGLFWAKRLS